MTADPSPPGPEARALEGAAGTPVALAGGAEWLLADGGLCNELDDARDRLDDRARLDGSVPMALVLDVAWVLLRANYELTPAELAALLAGADPDALADAVFGALYGPTAPRRTYTAWAASALIANGIDPATVPGPLRPHVLQQLVATGRAIPMEKYIESAEASRRRAGLLARAARPSAAAEAPREA